MRKIVCITISILLFLLSGCNKVRVEENPSSRENVSVQETAPVSDEITIYCFDREELYKLLESPSFETLQTLEYEAFNYPDNGEEHYKYSGYVLKVDKEFRDFINASSNMEKFLAERGIQETVRRSTVFETRDTKLMILVETETNVYFIKLNEIVDEETVKYNLYSKEDFINKNQIVEADITVDGRSIVLANKAKILGYNSEVPYIETMQAIGAEFEWTGDSTAIMTYNGLRYELDTAVPSIRKEGGDVNYFYRTGSYYVYKVGNEIYVPSGVLISTMYFADVQYYCREDKPNKMIYFDKR